VHESGAPAIYCDLGFPALAPLAVCGDGVVRLFSFVVELTAVKGGVLLIDEIDAGLHYSVMVPFWRALRKLADEHDVQIFATTHNDNLIRSAMAAFDDDLSWLCLFRLDRRKQGIVAVRYDEEALATARDERFEVRG
jgi:AAA15 family ATPase/GTPase